MSTITVWVLVLSFFTARGPVVVSTVDNIASKDACVTAWVALVKADPGSFGSVSYSCFPVEKAVIK